MTRVPPAVYLGFHGRIVVGPAAAADRIRRASPSFCNADDGSRRGNRGKRGVDVAERPLSPGFDELVQAVVVVCVRRDGPACRVSGRVAEGGTIKPVRRDVGTE